MAGQKDWRNELGQVAEFLREPFKMRMAVAAVTLIVMSFAINDPLQGKMDVSKRELNKLKTKVNTAEQVMLLRDHLSRVDERIFAGNSNDVVVSHLIELVRSVEGVDLMRIDAGQPQKLTPLQSVRISIDVLGPYTSLIELLHRFDTDKYLLRVEELAIDPPGQNRAVSSLNVTLRILKEKS